MQKILTTLFNNNSNDPIASGSVSASSREHTREGVGGGFCCDGDTTEAGNKFDGCCDGFLSTLSPESDRFFIDEAR